jgi:hypothetical protein
MAGRTKVSFFLPRQKRETETQTRIVIAPERPRLNIPIRMRQKAIEGMMNQDPRPANALELTYMLDYNNRLGFILCSRTDPRFDPLSRPPKLFEEFQIGFFVVFRNDTLEFANADRTRSVAYVYHEPVISLIESLETRVVGRELGSLLRKQLHVSGWDDGHILCHITDYRFGTPVEYRQMLRVTEGAVFATIADRRRQGRRDIDPMDRKNAPGLELEQQVLMLTRRSICVDPSPDVARVQSSVDWRQHMWQRRTRLDTGALVIVPRVREGPPITATIKLEPVPMPIVVPDILFQAITNCTNAVKTPGKVE